MKVGDLVRFSSDHKKVGIIFVIDEAIDHADPDIKWCGILWSDGRRWDSSPAGRTVTASRYLEVISESR